MSDRVQIQITGNATSAVQSFTEVTNGAARMGETVQRSGQAAGQSMTQMGAAAEASSARTSASYEKIGNAIGKTALAFGAFSLISGKLAGDSEASSARMQTAFQNAGLSVEDYQGKINQLTSTGLKLAFDDEDVQDALSRLITVTGNVDKSFKDVGLAEDIARSQGISLASATQLVVQAENGRFRGLAALGVAIDATSTKESVLADAQTKFSGQAAAFATTGAANFERWKNAGENALESVGGHLESLQMPIIALSTAGAALGPLAGSLKELAASGALLDVALGPIGLAAAALAAGAGIFYLFGKTNEYASAASAATTQSIDLNNALVILASTSSPTNATIIDQLNTDTKALLTTAGDAQDRIAGLTELISRMGQGATSLDLFNETQLQSAEAITHMTAAQLHALDVNQDSIVTYQEMKDAINGVIPAISSLAGLANNLSPDQMNQFTADFKTLIELPNANIPAISTAIEGLIQQFESGAISSADFVKGMDALTADVSPFVLSVNAATSATQGNTTAVSANGTAIAAQMALYASQNQSLGQAIDFTAANTAEIMSDTVARESNTDSIIGQMNAYAAANPSLETHDKIWVDMVFWANAWKAASDFSKSSASLNLVSDAMGALDTTTKSAIPDTKEYSKELEDQAQSAANAAKAIDDYRSKLGEVHMVVNDGVNQFAKHATVSGNALDAGNQVIVGNTNAIASASQGVADWGAKLIAVRGTIGEIDTLLAKGIITQDEYNRAQSAETSIFHENFAIQNDILKIQTDQSPVMARLLKDQAGYMDQLAAMPAAQQLVTLGFMDSAESAKALAADQLALSAASGELGESGVKTANKMIQAAAEADPVLKAMLVDMGLITVGADGTITVNFGDVTESKDEMGLLLQNIGDLIKILEDVFGIKVDHGDVDAAYQVTHDLNGELNTLDGRQISYSVAGTYTVTGDQGSSAAGAGTGNESIGVGPGQGPRDPGGSGGDEFGSATGARLGGVLGYAHGGVVAMMAEAGPELMHFANGGTALARYRGLYNVPHGTYVDTAPTTKAKLAGMGRPIVIEHMTVIANDSQQFADAMRAFELSNAR